MMQKDVKTIGVDETIKDAAKAMYKNHVGALVVVDKKKEGKGRVPVGIITDRDLALLLRKKENFDPEITVRDAMEKNVIVCSEKDGIFEVMHKMMQNGVRRMPVLNSKDQIMGMITSDDFVLLLANEMQDLSQIINAEIDKESKVKKKNKKSEQLRLRTQLAG